MRSALLLLVILLLVVVDAGQGVQPRDVSGVKRGTLAWYTTPAGIASTEYSAVEAQLYRFDIKPVTPESGISAGYVIAYGHPLKRPYRFDIKDDTLLLLNGVQVLPWLRNSPFPSADSAHAAQVWRGGWTQEELDHMMAIVASCGAIFERLSAGGRSSNAAIAESIRTALKHRADVVGIDVHCDTTDVSFAFRVRPTRRGARDLQSPTFVMPETRTTTPFVRGPDTMPARVIRRSTIEMTISQDSRWLLHGGLLMYGPLTSGNCTGQYFDSILSIMRPDSLTWGQKAAALHALRFLPVFRQVKEVMYNFVPAEYQAVLEER